MKFILPEGMNQEQRRVLRAFFAVLAVTLLYVPWQGQPLVESGLTAHLQYSWLWRPPESLLFHFRIDGVRLGLQVFSLAAVLLVALVCLQGDGEREAEADRGK